MIRELTQLHEALQRSFREVRLEMDDHLDAINQNTSEVSALYSYFRELDAKLDKLSDRVDELSLLLRPDPVDYSSIKLSRQEQEVFSALYASDGPLTPSQVGSCLGLSKQLAAQYLYNLQLKGVPMVARNWNGELFYSLEMKFKDLQSRKNLLRVPDDVLKKVEHII